MARRRTDNPDVLYLLYTGGDSIKDVSVKTGIPESSVQKLLLRAGYQMRTRDQGARLKRALNGTKGKMLITNFKYDETMARDLFENHIMGGASISKLANKYQIVVQEANWQIQELCKKKKILAGERMGISDEPDNRAIAGSHLDRTAIAG